jgi:dTDP-4-amino-4,6-dideoxygalactose transaminase
MIDKVRIDNLAIFGAPPAFPETLHVGRPNIGNRERLFERIGDILDGGWLTNNGPFVQEFEQRLAALAGVKHCVAVCNATIALELTIRALGLTGEVIVPSFTFVATAHALQSQGITPVFCDIDPQTHNLDPHKIAAAITPRTTGILGVHLWGRASDVAALTEIAVRRRLTLLFDAAHALGCSAGGRMIGNFGSAEVFSFHATKFLNTSEGGAAMTNDGELAAKIRLMRNFGFTGYDRVASIGTNGKMSEITAAMGITSLESISEFIAVNLRHYQQYREELASLPGVRLVPYDASEKCNYQYIVLEIDAGLAQITRDELVRVLWAENVIARRYFYPGCHRMEPYRSLYPQAGAVLPVTEWLAERVLVLPTGTAVGPEQISTICQILKTAVSQGAAIHQQLSKDAHQAASATESTRSTRSAIKIHGNTE